MTSTQDRWIELSDFTPGIFSDFHAGGGAGARAAVLKNGAATVENTYRCVGDPRGGLSPLPRRDGKTFTGTTPTVSIPGGATTNYATNYKALYLFDAVGLSQRPDGSSATDERFNLAVLFGVIMDPAGGGFNQCRTIGRGWSHSALANWTASFDYLYELHEGYSSAQLHGGALNVFRSIGAAVGPPIPVDSLLQGIVGSVSNGTGHAAAAIPAAELPLTTYDTDISGNFPSGVTAFGDGYLFLYPNPTGGAAPHLYTGATRPDGPTHVVVHQGRIAAISVTGDTSTGKFSFFSRERLFYTPPFDAKGLTFTSGPQVTVTADDSQIGNTAMLASVSNDELLLLRFRGGATLIRGDLDNPTYQRLAGVRSVGNALLISPVFTPDGLFYCTGDGVCVWNGGDTSQLVSPQLDGAFWDPRTSPTTELMYGFHGRNEFWYPYVLTPNNWMFDTRSQAWWRLDDVATVGVGYGAYVVNASTGRLMAFPYKFTANNQQLFYTFDQTVLATTWSWQSQPLIESRDRVLAVRELELVVSPGSNVNTNQSIAVTVTGYDDTGAPSTATKTFTFSGVNGAQPIILRGDLSAELQGRYIQVRFVADGGSAGGGNGNAPKLLSARFATRDNQQPRKL